MDFARGGTLEGLGGPIRMDEVKYDGIDPTLDACCQREVQSNRYGNALTRTLQRHDVVAMAERRRRNLVTTVDNVTGCRCCYDPNSDGGEYRALIELREQRSEKNNHSRLEGDETNDNHPKTTTKTTEEDEKPVTGDTSEESDSDDEFDYLLDEDIGDENNSLLKQAEERRRAELEYAALTQQFSTQHGYGIHRQIHPSRILRAAGLGGEGGKNGSVGVAPAVVLHLVDPDSIASASLDLFLEEVAGNAKKEGGSSSSPDSRYYGRARGTKFMRSGGRSTLLMDANLASKVLPRLQPDRDIPALVAIRDGVVVNTCPKLSGLTTDHVSEEVDVEAVYQWLDCCGMIIPQPPSFFDLCSIRPEEEALMDYLEGSAAAVKEEEERFDCGNPDCNKSFPHEHVGMQNEQQSGLVVSEEEILGAD